MCQSSVPERTQPAPRKPSNRSAIDVPACTHACMSRSSSAATRRVIETVSGPSSAPAVVTSVVVPVLVLMLEGSSGAGSRAGLPGPGSDDAGRPEGATGIRRRDARVLRYAWCGDTREVRTSLADAEAREGRRLGAALLEHLADGLLGVLGERLLEQHVLLEEAVDATLDDAGKGSLGLALLLGRGLGDATLVLDRLGRDLVTRQDGRAERRDVHRDVAAHGLVATLERDEDADLRRQVGARLVEVGHDLVALEARHEGDKVVSYLHKTSPDLPAQIGVLVALQGGDESVGRDVAMHIAAFSPTVLTRDEVPAETVENERRVAEATAKEEGKPEAALPRIVEGRVNGYFKENVLLEQPFAKEAKKTVGKVLEESGAQATSFARFRVGQ